MHHGRAYNIEAAPLAPAPKLRTAPCRTRSSTPLLLRSMSTSPLTRRSMEPTALSLQLRRKSLHPIAIHRSLVPSSGFCTTSLCLLKGPLQAPTAFCGGASPHPPRRLYGGDSPTCAISKGDGNTASLPRVATRPIDSVGFAHVNRATASCHRRNLSSKLPTPSMRATPHRRHSNPAFLFLFTPVDFQGWHLGINLQPLE
jgi:hypothetical protein